MRLIKLELEGFMSYKDYTVLPLEQFDLFLISGPVGAGKSSLFDAICYALYGRTPRISTSRDLINRRSDEMIVRLVFSVDGKVYRVSRYQCRSRKRKHASRSKTWLEELREDGPRNLSSGREVDSDIIRILKGLDFKTFTKSVLLPQGEFDAFLKDSSARREVLIKLFGLELYDEIFKRVRERRDLKRGELQAVTQQLRKVKGELSSVDITQLNSELERIETQIRDLETELTLLGELRTQFSTLLKPLREMEKLRDEIKNYILEHPKQLILQDEVNYAFYKHIKPHFDTLSRYISELLQTLQEEVKLRHELIELKGRLLEINRRLEELQNIDVKLQYLKDEVLRGLQEFEIELLHALNNLTELRGNEAVLIESVRELEAIFHELDIDISQKFSASTVRYTNCEPILEAISELMERLSVWEKLVNVLSNIRNTLNNLQLTLRSITRLSGEYESKLREISELSEEQRNLKSELQRVKVEPKALMSSFQELQDTLKRLCTELSSDYKQLEKSHDRYGELQSEIKAYREKLKELEPLKVELMERHEKLNELYRTLESEYDILEKAKDIASKLKVGDICPVCGKKITYLRHISSSEISQRLREIEMQLESVRTELNRLEVDRARIMASLDTKRRELDNLKVEAKSVLEDVKLKLNTGLRRLENLITNFELSESLSLESRKFSDLRERLDKLWELKPNLNQKPLETLKLIIDNLDAISGITGDLRDSLEELVLSLISKQERLEELERRLNALPITLKQLRDNLKDNLDSCSELIEWLKNNWWNLLDLASSKLALEEPFKWELCDKFQLDELASIGESEIDTLREFITELSELLEKVNSYTLLLEESYSDEPYRKLKSNEKRILNLKENIVRALKETEDGYEKLRKFILKLNEFIPTLRKSLTENAVFTDIGTYKFIHSDMKFLKDENCESAVLDSELNSIYSEVKELERELNMRVKNFEDELRALSFEHSNLAEKLEQRENEWKVCQDKLKSALDNRELLDQLKAHIEHDLETLPPEILGYLEESANLIVELINRVTKVVLELSSKPTEYSIESLSDTLNELEGFSRELDRLVKRYDIGPELLERVSTRRELERELTQKINYIVISLRNAFPNDEDSLNKINRQLGTDLVKLLGELKEKLSLLDNPRILLSETSLEIVDFLLEAKTRLEETITEIDLNTTDLKCKLDELRGKLDNLKRKLYETENLEREYQQLEGELEKLNTQVKIYDRLWLDFRGDGLRNFAVNLLIDELIITANEIFSELTDGRYEFFLSDNEHGSNLQVLDRWLGNEVRPIKSLSGGETFLGSLSLALALSRYLTYGKLKLQTLFIDEGFGSLDSTALTMVMHKLRQIQLQGITIGVISHVEEMRNWFDKIVLVKSEQGNSKLELIGV